MKGCNCLHADHKPICAEFNFFGRDSLSKGMALLGLGNPWGSRNP